jgi:chemotaxis-related protein WspD
MKSAVINDCWNRIGVQGDRSCPELVQHIHCRNCPVYSAAAALLLDGEMGDAYVHERTAHFSREQADHSHDTLSLVIFRIGREWLSLPSSTLLEVTDVRPVHPIPHNNGGVVQGLVNLRGELLICVSVGRLLGLESSGKAGSEQERTPGVCPRLLVIHDEGGRLAFPVDEIDGIHRLDPRTLDKVPATIANATSAYSEAMLPWKNGTVGCLDPQLLLYALNRSLA